MVVRIGDGSYLCAFQDGHLECFVWDGYGDVSRTLLGDYPPRQGFPRMKGER